MELGTIGAVPSAKSSRDGNLSAILMATWRVVERWRGLRRAGRVVEVDVALPERASSSSVSSLTEAEIAVSAALLDVVRAFSSSSFIFASSSPLCTLLILSSQQAVINGTRVILRQLYYRVVEIQLVPSS